MVPGAGVEPARPLSRGILSPLRLPVSPPGLHRDGLWCHFNEIDNIKTLLIILEAEGGIEPPSTALQAAA